MVRRVPSLITPLSSPSGHPGGVASLAQCSMCLSTSSITEWMPRRRLICHVLYRKMTRCSERKAFTHTGMARCSMRFKPAGSTSAAQNPPLPHTESWRLC
eukprot:Rmarinus@m.28674